MNLNIDQIYCWIKPDSSTGQRSLPSSTTDTDGHNKVLSIIWVPTQTERKVRRCPQSVLSIVCFFPRLVVFVLQPLSGSDFVITLMFDLAATERERGARPKIHAVQVQATNIKIRSNVQMTSMQSKFLLSLTLRVVYFLGEFGGLNSLCLPILSVMMIGQQLTRATQATQVKSRTGSKHLR